jgi:hypothetical protein
MAPLPSARSRYDRTAVCRGQGWPIGRGAGTGVAPTIYPAPGFTTWCLNNGAVRRLTRYGAAVYFPGSSGNEGWDRREPWLDITDTKVEFALAVPRAAGAIIAAGVAGTPRADAGFAPTGPSSMPTTLSRGCPAIGLSRHRLLARSCAVRHRAATTVPTPAQLGPHGLLVPEATKPDVTFTLPPLKVRVSQGSGPAAAVDGALASLGVSGLVEPGDIAAAELVKMEPPYAFIGNDRVVGKMLRTAELTATTRPVANTGASSAPERSKAPGYKRLLEFLLRSPDRAGRLAPQCSRTENGQGGIRC